MSEASATKVLFSPAEQTHYFAVKLTQVTSLSTLAVDPGIYRADANRRTIKLLTSLVASPDSRFTYDLRTIVEPDLRYHVHGVTNVYVICRADTTEAEAQLHAHGLQVLLSTAFPEYRFALVPGSEVPKVLRPFHIRYIFGISRRASQERLDTLRSGTRISRHVGFAADAEEAPLVGDFGPECIFHVFPYLQAPPSGDIYRLLLMQDAPVCISCRIQPAKLRPEEEDLLQRQIAKCECYAQLTIGPVSGDASALEPTLHDQARVYEQYQQRMLFGLRDNTALLTIEVASPEPLSQIVVESVGTFITQPAGGTEDTGDKSMVPYFAGGFEVLQLDPPAAQNFEKLQFTLVFPPAAPSGAERLTFLFDSVEAMAPFRLPPPTVDESCGVPVQYWRDYPASRDLPETGLLIGESFCPGGVREVRLGREDRLRHMYVVGQTGTGKTTLLKTLILDDINSGEGLCVIDPHGDLFRDILGSLPESRLDDVVVLDPTDMERPVGLNLLECDNETQRHFIVQEFVGIIARMLQDEYGPRGIEMVGPIFFQQLRMNLLLTMSRPEDPGTLVEFHTIFQEPGYWKRWLPLGIGDPQLKRWVTSVLPTVDMMRQGQDNASLGAYLSSKFENFIFDPMLRNIFGQKRSTIDLRRIMDDGKILLVNLAKGELTETNSRFLGMILMAKLLAAAMGRVKMPVADRRNFFLYVDEFQSIATQSFVTLVSEARKFGLSLVLANQFISQIHDERILESIFGNVATTVCFRLGHADAELLEKEMWPTVNRLDLVNLPNWRAYITTLASGQALRPFTIRTVLPQTAPQPTRAARAHEMSRLKYGRPRADVDKDLQKSRKAGAGE